MSAQERTGWRDEELSLRHRLWGENVPCADLDFILIEYDRMNAVAVIDYKHEKRDPKIDLHSANVKAFSGFCSDAKRPAFIVRYRCQPEHPAWEFCIVPLNEFARQHAVPGVLSEADYVKWIYCLRGRECPSWILTRLKEVA